MNWVVPIVYQSICVSPWCKKAVDIRVTSYNWTCQGHQLLSGFSFQFVQPIPWLLFLGRKKEESVLPTWSHLYRNEDYITQLQSSFSFKWESKSFVFFLSFHHRFRILWDEEVDRVGAEKASLGQVVWKFQRTRVLMDIVANILCIIMAAIGPVSGTNSSASSLRFPRTSKNDFHYSL